MTKFHPALLLLAACGGGDETTGEACFPTTIEATVCDPAVATFSLASTNPYYPLHVGSVAILEGSEEGDMIRIERRVLADTEVVIGVTTHVLEAREYVNDEIFEIARNFYVEASDGTVCYFGEFVEFYENGVVANNDGSWRAGDDGARPGIIMPASPQAGDAYFQENAPGNAIDMGHVVSTTMTLIANGETHTNVVVVMDANPLEVCEEEEQKLYVPGIGEAGDTVKTLVSFEPGTEAFSSTSHLRSAMLVP
jgi:hypothetical protein